MSKIQVYVVAGRNPTTPWRILTKIDGREVSRKSSRTTDRAKAESMAREALARLEAALDTSPPERLQDPTVRDVFDHHVNVREHDRTTKTSTLRSLRSIVERLGSLGEVRASELDTAAVLRARDELLTKLAPSTVRTTVVAWKAAWTWAQQRGLVEVEWPSLPRLRVKATTKRPWRTHEVELLRRRVWERWPQHAEIVEVLVSTGARLGSVLALRGRDVDRERRQLYLSHVKTGEPLVVGIDAEALEHVPHAERDAYVWPGRRGGHRSPGALQQVLADVREWLGSQGVPDPERLDWHSLRRAWVADAHAAGVPLDVARRQTGHRSLRVHLDYARHAEVDLGGAVEEVRRRRSGVHPEAGSVHQGNDTERPEMTDSGQKRRPACTQGTAQDQGPGGGCPPRKQAGSTEQRAVTGLFRWTPHGLTYGRWAEEDPEALRDLLANPLSQAALRQALDELRNEDAPTRQAKDTG